MLQGTDDFRLLQRYMTALSESGAFWLGYRYENSSTLVSRDRSPIPSVLTEEANFGAGEAAAADVCVAVASDGKFHRMNCSETLRYACSMQYTAGEFGVAVHTHTHM